MSVWAIADLHLAFGVPSKSMEVFGPEWKNYGQKIEENWRELISPEDLVLIPGDISWGMRLEEALIDLNWIDALPGTKVIIRGNHDYWWASASKLSKILPPSIHFIQNNVFNWQDITIGGTRLWDTREYSFHSYIDFRENKRVKEKVEDPEEEKRIFDRELERLKLSLQQLNSEARLRIALTHYPPIGADLQPSQASALLEEFNIQICVFGHLHQIKRGASMFGEARGVRYVLSSADYLDFRPLLICK